MKRRWDDDVVFKNQARGTEDKNKKKEFVNVSFDDPSMAFTRGVSPGFCFLLTFLLGYATF